MSESRQAKLFLGSVRVEGFYGERSKYQAWQRAAAAQQQLYQLADSELSMLVYSTSHARKIWRLLDEAYHETSEEHFERLEHEFSLYRKMPGQSVPSCLSQIERLKMEYVWEDKVSRMSDRAWAQRLLLRASLSKRGRLDCFFSAGRAYM